MVVTASEIGRYINPDQAANESLLPSRKWFSLQDNRLDGSFHPLPADGSMQVGWWGTTLSNATGTISTSPTLSITMNRSVHSLQVVGDSLLGEYPVDFAIRLYNGSTLLHAETVTNNTIVHWKKALSKTYDVTKIELTVTKVNKANRSVKVLEALNPFEIYRSDQMPVDISKAIILGNQILSQENVTLIVEADSKDVTAMVDANEDISINVADSSFYELYEFIRKDALKPIISDVSTPVIAMFGKSDNLKVKISEDIVDFTVKLTKGEPLLLDPSIEAEDITVELPLRADVLNTITQESKDMTNIHTVMNSNGRKVYAKVEILYTDPFMDLSVDFDSNGSAYPTSPEQSGDNIQAAPYKWFSLHNNRLDGSYHPISEKGTTGWWSNKLSDADGRFVENPILSISFDPRPIFSLKAFGDDKLREYPEVFTIRLYSGNDLVYNHNVTNNTDVHWEESIDEVLNVTRMELEIIEINRPYSVAKILEFYTSVKEVYTEEEIISLSLLEELESSDGTLSIGNISSNELRVRLNNIDRRFDPGNPHSPLQNLLRKNRRMRAWLGTEIIPNEVEWYQIGEFWTQDWTAPERDTWVETTGWDKMESLRTVDFESEVYQNKSLGDLAEIVLVHGGLTERDYEIDATLYNTIIPWSWFGKTNCRDALQSIAAAGLAIAYCNRFGKIVMEVFVPDEFPLFEFDLNNIFDKDSPLALNSMVNYIEVATKPRTPGNIEYVYEDSEEIFMNPGENVTIVHAFNFAPVIETQMPEITAGDGIDIISWMPTASGMMVIYKNNSTGQRSINNIKIRGRKLDVSGSKIAIAKDDISIRDNGKQALSNPISNELIQTTAQAQSIANKLLASYKDLRRDLSLDARGNIALELGDRVVAPDYLDITKSQYFITRQELEWDGALRATIEAQKIPEGDD